MTRWAVCSPQGADVVAKYYFNVAPRSTDSPTLSAAVGEPPPQDGYAGGYIASIAEQVLQKAP